MPHRRRTSNSVISEHALHELYMPAFKAGADAGAMAVMTAYNQLNGEWCGQSKYVISNLLRKDIGFKWLVMSDWWSVWDPEKAIESGLDLDMPGETVEGMPMFDHFGDSFLRSNAKLLLNEGKVKIEDINRMAANIIATELAMELDKRPVKDESYLKNFEMIDALKAEYDPQVNFIEEPTNEEIQNANIVICATGTFDSEGWDNSFALPDQEEARIKKIVQQNENTIIVVNSGSGIKMTGWKGQAAAILYCWYPGQMGNKALAEVIAWKVFPSGKLPITIEQQFEDSPGHPYIPDGEKLYYGWEIDYDMNIKPLYGFGHELSYTSFEYGDIELSFLTNNKNKH